MQINIPYNYARVGRIAPIGSNCTEQVKTTPNSVAKIVEPIEKKFWKLPAYGRFPFPGWARTC